MAGNLTHPTSHPASHPASQQNANDLFPEFSKLLRCHQNMLLYDGETIAEMYDDITVEWAYIGEGVKPPTTEVVGFWLEKPYTSVPC